MTGTIDLNCDMGESFGIYEIGDDAAMLEIFTTANIACGFHGGDPLVMHRTLPIRLTPMTATCRVPPLSRVKLGIGWSRGVARDAEQ